MRVVVTTTLRTPTAAISLGETAVRDALEGGTIVGTEVSISSMHGSIYTTFTISTNTANYNIQNALTAAGYGDLIS